MVVVAAIALLYKFVPETYVAPVTVKALFAQDPVAPGRPADPANGRFEDTIPKAPIATEVAPPTFPVTVTCRPILV